MLCLTLIFLFLAKAAFGALDFKIFDYGPCPEFKDYGWMINLKDKIEQDAQFFLGHALMWKEIGADNTFAIVIERVYPKRNRHLLTLKSKNACDALKNQGGAAWQEVAKLVGIEHPEKCPIPKKNYSLTSWYKLDAKKIPLLLMVPKGTFRIHLSVHDLKRKLDCCHRFTFQRY